MMDPDLKVLLGSKALSVKVLASTYLRPLDRGLFFGQFVDLEAEED